MNDFVLLVDLDSEVWRGTCNLSGGQQQLLSLARAALRSSPVLVLDEPSSALDQEAEQTLHSCLEHLFKDRTILLVAVSHFHYISMLLSLKSGIRLKLICIFFSASNLQFTTVRPCHPSGGRQTGYARNAGSSAKPSAHQRLNPFSRKRQTIHAAIYDISSPKPSDGCVISDHHLI